MKITIETLTYSLDCVIALRDALKADLKDLEDSGGLSLTEADYNAAWSAIKTDVDHLNAAIEELGGKP